MKIHARLIRKEMFPKPHGREDICVEKNGSSAHELDFGFSNYIHHFKGSGRMKEF